MTYADTNFLLRYYVSQTQTQELMRMVASLKVRLPVTWILELELPNFRRLHTSLAQ